MNLILNLRPSMTTVSDLNENTELVTQTSYQEQVLLNDLTILLIFHIN